VFGPVVTLRLERPGVAIVLFNFDFSMISVVSPAARAVVLPILVPPVPTPPLPPLPPVPAGGVAGGVGVGVGVGGGQFTPQTGRLLADDIALVRAPPPPPHAARETDEAKTASNDT
jgi:hypothetical protein